jgi:copper chaperone CopZ
MKIAENSSTGSAIATFDIGGMHCSSCSSLIEKSLGQISGVGEANVNYASEKARIKYNPKLTNPEALKQAIVNA